MTEPTILRWPLPMPVPRGGVPIACPTCGGVDRLVIAMDLDDRSEEPSYMTCQQGHTWAEPLLPRRFGAQLLGDILEADPSLLGRLDDLREVQARGEA